MQKAQRRLHLAPSELPLSYLVIKAEHWLQWVDLAEVRYLEGLQI